MRGEVPFDRTMPVRWVSKRSKTSLISLISSWETPGRSNSANLNEEPARRELPWTLEPVTFFMNKIIISIAINISCDLRNHSSVPREPPQLLIQSQFFLLLSIQKDLMLFPFLTEMATQRQRLLSMNTDSTHWRWLFQLINVPWFFYLLFFSLIAMVLYPVKTRRKSHLCFGIFQILSENLLS